MTANKGEGIPSKCIQSDFTTCTDTDYIKGIQVVRFDEVSFFFYEEKGYSIYGRCLVTKLGIAGEQNLVTDQVSL